VRALARSRALRARAAQLDERLKRLRREFEVLEEEKNLLKAQRQWPPTKYSRASMGQTPERGTLTEQLAAVRARVAACRIGDRGEFRETMDRLRAEKERLNRELDRLLGVDPS
jgi:hypothetical protein